MSAIDNRQRVALNENNVVVYRGFEVDADVLEAIVNTNQRLLWAFLKNDVGVVRAVPYSEEKVIWIEPDDILKPADVEL